MAIGLLAKLIAKNAGTSAKVASTTASAGAKTAKGVSSGAQAAAKAAKSPGLIKKAIGATGALGAIGMVADSLFGGDEEEKGKGEGIENVLSKPTATEETSKGLMLYDFASMLDQKMVTVPSLPELIIDESDMQYVDATLDEDVAIPYDIEKMFDKERGSLIIPRDTYLDFSSDKIKGITTAVLRLAGNLELVNQQIGMLNNRTNALERAVKEAQDLNRRAILEYNRQQDEDDLEDTTGEKVEKGFLGRRLDDVKDAAKLGLGALATGAAAAAVAVGANFLGSYFDQADAVGEAARADALAQGLSEEEAAALAEEAKATAEDETYADEIATGLGTAAAVGGGVVAYKAGKSGVEKVAASKVGQKVGMKTAAQKAAGKKATGKGGKVVAKTAVKKAIEKIAPKKLGSLAGRAVPGVSWLIGGAIATVQAVKGDYTGAALTAAGSVGGIITALPVIGLEITREVYNAVYGTEERPYPHESDAINDPEYGAKQAAIYEPVTEYIGKWFEDNAEYPKDEESLKSAIEKGIYDHNFISDSEVDLERITELTAPEIKSIIADDDVDNETIEALKIELKKKEFAETAVPRSVINELNVVPVEIPTITNNNIISTNTMSGSDRMLEQRGVQDQKTIVIPIVMPQKGRQSVTPVPEPLGLSSKSTSESANPTTSTRDSFISGTMDARS